MAIGSDGTVTADRRKIGIRGRQGAGELEVGAGIELAQAIEAQARDAIGVELAAGSVRFGLDPVDERLDVAGAHRPFVGGAEQGGAQLGSIEALAAPIALSHVGGLGVAPFEGGEPVAARGALAAATQRGAAVGTTALEDVRPLVASRAVHEDEFY